MDINTFRMPDRFNVDDIVIGVGKDSAEFVMSAYNRGASYVYIDNILTDILNEFETIRFIKVDTEDDEILTVNNLGHIQELVLRYHNVFTADKIVDHLRANGFTTVNILMMGKSGFIFSKR